MSEDNTTEKRILEAAEDEFLKKGFAATRTTSIADKAGVTHAMLHYYFRTKEKLFETVISRKMTEVRDLIFMSISREELSLIDKLKMVITVHLQFFMDHPDLPRFFIQEVASNPERMAPAVEFLRRTGEKLSTTLQREIDKASEGGIVKKVDARMLILDIASLNAFPFVASNIVNPLLGGIMDDREAFIEKRKKLTFEIIASRLLP